MKFLLLNTDYPQFLKQMYSRNPGLEHDSYERQLAARNETFFGVSDAYAQALRDRGHAAFDIHMNNSRMQRAWVAEQGQGDLARSPVRWQMRVRRRFVPWPERLVPADWYLAALESQIQHHQPDVVLNHDISWIDPRILRTMVGPGVMLIGQHAAPPLPDADFTPYDLIVSSWPPTLERMRSVGIRAAHLALGFDPRVLDHLPKFERDIPASFVGSLSGIHGERTETVEALCRAIDGFRVYAPSIESLSRHSPIRSCYAGPAFGIEMFAVLARSLVTVNHHGFVQPHANNMRLFEATGVGALLLTDGKPDIRRYFIPGVEILTYTDATDALALIQNGLQNAAAIAAAGQRRTLAEHTWKRRIDELLELLD